MLRCPLPAVLHAAVLRCKAVSPPSPAAAAGAAGTPAPRRASDALHLERPQRAGQILGATCISLSSRRRSAPAHAWHADTRARGGLLRARPAAACRQRSASSPVHASDSDSRCALPLPGAGSRLTPRSAAAVTHAGLDGRSMRREHGELLPLLPLGSAGGAKKRARAFACDRGRTEASRSPCAPSPAPWASSGIEGGRCDARRRREALRRAAHPARSLQPDWQPHRRRLAARNSAGPSARCN